MDSAATTESKPLLIIGEYELKVKVIECHFSELFIRVKPTLLYYYFFSSKLFSAACGSMCYINGTKLVSAIDPISSFKLIAVIH